MNIIDALKSGRRVRLLDTEDQFLHDWFDPTETGYVLDHFEILSDKWEVEEVKRSFTAAELKLRLSEIYHSDDLLNLSESIDILFASKE